MKSSEVLIRQLIAFEGLSLTAYRCPAGVLTIGVGHTAGVRAGQKITREQALSLLRGDLLPCECFVNSLCVCKTQGQFDALVDFVFNLGADRLLRSSLLQKIRAKAPAVEIKKEFMKWRFAAGKALPGLERRRKWEAERFFS